VILLLPEADEILLDYCTYIIGYSLYLSLSSMFCKKDSFNASLILSFYFSFDLCLIYLILAVFFLIDASNVFEGQKR